MPAGYRNLIAWQKSMDLAERIYQISSRFPQAETYGLTSQVRRAAVSVPSNIAEGRGRETKGDYCRFLSIALGSLCELETQILLALRLHYINEKDVESVLSLSTEVARLLTGLKKSIER